MSTKPSKNVAHHGLLMQAVHELASAARLTCLDPEWLGARHGYLFRCEQGHDATRRLDGLKSKRRSAPSRQANGANVARP